MKEFIDKLIERLEKKSFIDYDEYYTDGGECLISISDVKEIVNELAEEYINCSTDISTKSSDCSTKVSEMPTGWISVSDRLPSKANHNVLVTYKDRYIGGVYGVCEGQYVHSLKEWQITDYAIDDDFNVIAWCEKPAPYTEGE